MRGRKRSLLETLYQYRMTVWILAVANVRDRYAGTWGGLAWGVLQPLMLMGVFWVVFANGFRMAATSEHPYLLELFCGLVPWMTFSDAVLGAAGAVSAKAYLVRKIAFPTEVLPVTQVLAAMLTHFVLLGILLAMLAWYGLWPGRALVWLPYFAVCLIALASGMGFLLSALSVFNRDLAQALGILMNMLFWATPVVWPPGMVKEYAWIVDFNPVAYIVAGYREAFLFQGDLSVNLHDSMRFWLLCGVVMLLGTSIFRRLKPSFADVL